LHPVCTLARAATPTDTRAVEAANWDPRELLVYAHEYLDLYILFAFRVKDQDEAYPGLALFYLEGSLECVEDAIAAMKARAA
jgi:hypothetical protein